MLKIRKRADGTWEGRGFPDEHVFSTQKVLELVTEGVLELDLGAGQATLRFANGEARYRIVQRPKDGQPDNHDPDGWHLKLEHPGKRKEG